MPRATFPLFCTKTAPTASSPEACLVAILMAEIVHQGVAGRARPECRYNIGVADLGEFVAFMTEMPDLVP
jgi:hypothetical protein